MKLVIPFLLFWSFAAISQDKPPAWMKGGRIVFIPADATKPEREWDPEKYGIFKRGKKEKPKIKSKALQAVVAPPKPCPACPPEKPAEIKYLNKYKFKRHRIGLSLGYGQSGVEITDAKDPYRTTIEPYFGYLGMLKYAYSFNATFSIDTHVISDLNLIAPAGFIGFGWGF